MTWRTLILHSLRFRWRTHLGVVLGAAVGSAALIGALIVGDSVRGSLRAQALTRLGTVWFALAPSDRFVTESLPDRMLRRRVDATPSANGGHTARPANGPAGILMLPAMVSREDQAARANQVTLLGVSGDQRVAPSGGRACFWDFSANRAHQEISRDEIWLNEALAAQLRARPGDTLLLRVRKPGLLSQEITVTPQSDTTAALRLRVGEIRTGPELGDFSLRATQVPPLNAFVNLQELQRLAGTTNQINVVMAPEVPLKKDDGRQQNGGAPGQTSAGKPADSPALQSRTGSPAAEALQQLQDELKSSLILADLEAALRPVPGNSLELSSRRVFLDHPLARNVLRSFPTARPILTFLVNQFRAGTNTTPYSMVTAAGAPWTPPEMRDDQILVNQWLADDLGVRPGDQVDLTYFLPDSAARLAERTNTFVVRDIVPLTGPFADPTLMPDFPGLAKAESTHDWEAGFPLVHKIREKDEQYWKQRRGTPKAFITLAAGQKMWANRFGDLTAIRFPRPMSPAEDAPSATPGRQNVSQAAEAAPLAADEPTGFRQRTERGILACVRPEEIGLRFEPARTQALNAASESQDFGGLFVGFSFFLIAAALILMGLLFQFGLEQRGPETGLLLALGFTPRQVRRLLLLEGSALALLGGLGGTLGGMAYARLMLRLLTTLWHDAVGTSALGFFITPLTLAAGLVTSVLISALTVWLVLRKQARASARELLSGELQEGGGEAAAHRGIFRNRSWGPPVALAGWSAGVALVGWAFWRGQMNNAEVFFGAGTLCLMGGIGGVSWVLARLKLNEPASAPGLAGFALRNCTRRHSRSLAVTALLACGVFIVASIGVFRLDANQQAWKRSSGTGGFALLGESTLPVTRDLNSTAGREFFGFDEKALQNVTVVPFRVRDGDEASCLNLNRAQKPRLLGVKPELLSERGAFTFAKVAKGRRPSEGWSLLRGTGPTVGPSDLTDSTPPEIPAIGDAASIQWALHKEIGDSLDYTDETGRLVRLRLVGAVANSVLQGSLIIDESQFGRLFPGETGYRWFLVDTPSNGVEQVAASLSRALQDVGLVLTPAARRLAQFNAVQNTYLSTFQVLGGVGLLLGSVGLGVVVLRNALERRPELALLLALGLRRRQVRWLVLGEHLFLLGAGLAAGTAAAAVAVLPALLGAPGEIPWASLSLTLAGVLAAGLLAALAGTGSALRGSLLESLRNE
jgi:putative ABC transport system permease protein